LCSRCGEKLFSQYVQTESGPLCGLCRRAEPPFQRAVAYGAYEEALRDLIHLLKYQRVQSVAPCLAKLLQHALTGLEIPQDTVVIPVPLFKGKRRTRGFNQAEQIAKAFVSHWKGSRIQLDTASLVRIRETASQTGLTRHQRRANLRGAFAVTRPDRLMGRTILLVDDVLTTGTTAAECARVLSRAGAGKVMVATVARAIRETEIRLQEPRAAHSAHA
jgi:ComF family protein